MKLPYTHIPKRRVLENRGLFLNNLLSYWLFYKACLSQDTEINNLI